MNDNDNDLIDENDIFDAEVVWYNGLKGFGFVMIEDEEVFIHKSSLTHFGLLNIEEGDELEVSLSNNNHGKVVKTIHSIARGYVADALTTATLDADEKEAEVKFFNMLKGYGFAACSPYEEDDVFIHASVLRKAHIRHLDKGQRLAVTVDPHRSTAKTIRLLLDRE